MTTVAYRDGVVAADSRGTVGGWVLPTREAKLFRLDDGRVAALTGGYAGATRLLAWATGDKATPQPEIGEARVILFSPGGRVEIYEDGASYTEHAEFMAWGSGMPAALGALHAGADAAEAVRIAGLVDTHTDTRVQIMKIEAGS